jgi:hypothetical protein
MRRRCARLGLVGLCLLLTLQNSGCAGGMSKEEHRDFMRGHLEKWEKERVASEARARGTVSIGPNAIGPALGYLLLIRRGKDLCAIRFTEFHAGDDIDLDAKWTAPWPTVYATYDWYYQGDGSGDLTRSTARSGQGALEERPSVGLRGMGHAMARGNLEVLCGPFRLIWLYPRAVGFAATWNDKGTVELAPTPWRQPSEVNLQEPRLQWYRYDDNRPRTSKPVEKLWE